MMLPVAETLRLSIEIGNEVAKACFEKKKKKSRKGMRK